MRRKYCILLLAALIPIAVIGKIRLPHSYIKTYRITDPLGLVDSVSSGGVDSSYINFAQRSILYNYSMLNLYNGNIVSPVLSGIYFNRTDKTNFIFGRGYDVYTIAPSEVNYFRTNIPYSYISYRRGLVSDGGDNDIDFLFTGNLSKATNLGVKINYLDGIGSYKNQAGRCIRGVVFGSYDGSVSSGRKSDERHGFYGISGAFSFNNLSNFENGGLVGSKSIFDAGSSSSDGGSVYRDLLNSGIQYKDIGVSMNAMSGYCYLNMNLNHHYTFISRQNISSKSTDGKSDSVAVSYLPLFTIRHIMSVSDSHRRYLERTASQNFYDNYYLNTLTTNDTCGSLSIDNTVSFNLDERYFYGLVTGKNRDTANLSYNPAEWLYLGLTLFVRNEAKRYVNNLAANYEVGTVPLFQSGWVYDVNVVNASRINRLPSRLEEVWYDNLYLGGSVYKRAGQ